MKKCLLVVDPDLNNAKLYQESIQGLEGFSIVQAPTFRDALIKASLQLFTVVIFFEDAGTESEKFIEDTSTLAAEVRPKHYLVYCKSMISSSTLRALLKSKVSHESLEMPVRVEALRAAFEAFLLPNNEATAPAKIDASIINEFATATLEVLKITAKVEAQKAAVFLRTKDQISGDVTALIAMNSGAYRGSMAISFSKPCFLFVVSNMLGETYTEVTLEIQDAAAELCNQIFGVAKKNLNEKGHSIVPAIPSIVVGDGHRVKHYVDGPCVAIQFKTSAGDFVIEAAQGKA